ncbi:site-2 protease family protein [Reinekea sp.]|jgi:Zn-dependent protease|uniref:site-2 protease family protein n=1 Tax=Reinekea sp. TaxID=1970455 RepID=UPI003988FE48
MTNVLVLIFIFFVFKYAGVFRQVMKLLGIKNQVPLMSSIPEESLTESERVFFDATAKPILAEGFVLSGFVHQQLMEADISGQLTHAVFSHPETNTFIYLRAALMPTAIDPCEIIIVTHLDSERAITSTNDFSSFLPIPNLANIHERFAVNDFSTLLRKHNNRAELKMPTQAQSNKAQWDHLASIHWLNQTWTTSVEVAISQDIFDGNTQAYYYRAQSAFRVVKEAATRLSNREKELTNRQKSDDPFAFRNLITAPQLSGTQENFINLHEKFETLPNRRAILPWITFVVSLIVFAVFFGFWLGWDFLPILVTVLIIHELGHYAAMRFFGYYQTSVFFIPGLGAAATGIAKKPNYWHRYIVYLAGPLPGLILGVLIVWYVGWAPEWLIFSAIVLIVINGFNLLPFMPLDGGQIIHMTLSERSRLYFSGFSGIGLLIIAYWMGEVILYPIGLFMLLAALNQYFTLDIRQQLSKLSANSTPETFISQALAIFNCRNSEPVDFPTRLALINEYKQDLGLNDVGFVAKTMAICLYLAILLTPFLVYFLIL